MAANQNTGTSTETPPETLLIDSLKKAVKDRNHEEVRRLLSPKRKLLVDTCFDKVIYLAFLPNDHVEVKVLNSLGNAVFHCTIEAEDIEILEYLVQGFKEYGCDVKAVNSTNSTVLHYAVMVASLDMVKCLINECGLDPSTCDKGGNTALHCAVQRQRGYSAEIIELILANGKCNPSAKNKDGYTPLMLLNRYKEGEEKEAIRLLFQKFGQIETSCPVDSYVNVLVLGNSGAGKSTLSNVINETNAGDFYFGSWREVHKAESCTAGIIPAKIKHRKLGNIILHDFAGHSEYYSSHSAVIESLLKGSGGVFLIVVKASEKGAVKQLHQWLMVISNFRTSTCDMHTCRKNKAPKACDQHDIIVIISHMDAIKDSAKRKKKEEKIKAVITEKKLDNFCFFIDCCKLGGSSLDLFFNKLSDACDTIRKGEGRKLSLYCHMLYGLLEEGKKNVLRLSDVISAAKDSDDYLVPDDGEVVLSLLNKLDSTGLISVIKSKDKVWVIVNKGILLTKVNGILFAPETFKEHINIASNTGIVRVSDLIRLFPDYDPEMLICFLKDMELCQENDLSFLRMTNLHQLEVREHEEVRETEETQERLLFFPCLLKKERPDETGSTLYTFQQFGWCLQCTGERHFFPPRFFHVLSLRFAYELAIAEQTNELDREGQFWSKGLCWSNGYGVRTLVEVVDESQCILVLVTCKKDCIPKMIELRENVIGKIVRLCKESYPRLKVEEFVIDPDDLTYPMDDYPPKERRQYNVHGILKTIYEGRPFLVTKNGEEEVKRILPDELSHISKLSLLGGRDIRVRN